MLIRNTANLNFMMKPLIANYKALKTCHRINTVRTANKLENETMNPAPFMS